MAARIDEFSGTTEKLKRMSPTHNTGTNPISTSSTNLTSHTTSLSVSISDDTHPLDKKATPKKKKEPFLGGLSLFNKKDKKEKDIKGTGTL
jgi:hypothetical protein